MRRIRKLDVAKAQELFEYKEGKLFWKAKPNNFATQAIIGEEAGALHENEKFRRISFDGERHYTHVVVWLIHGNELPDDHVIFHKDGDPLNNNIENLGVRSKSASCAQAKRVVKNKTGFKGVYPEKNRFLALMVIDGKRTRLGTFATPEEAAEAYQQKFNEIYGDTNETDPLS